MRGEGVKLRELHKIAVTNDAPLMCLPTQTVGFLLDVVEKARTYMDLVEEAASDGSFNPFAMDRMEDFNSADIEIHNALASLDEHLGGQE